MENKHFFSEAIIKISGRTPRIINIKYQHGGCINNAAIVETESENYFIKFNSKIPDDIFEKEYKGLLLLHQTKIIRVPQPLGYGKIGNITYLILEVINAGAEKKDFWIRFGSSLANLHYKIRSDFFGLEFDNYLGRLTQQNSLKEDWILFFIEQRLEFQLNLAISKGLIGTFLAEKFQAFYKLLPDLLPLEKPSLLHGDLWSGNFMTGNDGYATLIDPAVYFGHREAELSFTKMFGGFDDRFYQAYQETWPLEKGFEDRVDIYNLYPTLVHLNLFGAMYLAGITRVIDHYI